MDDQYSLSNLRDITLPDPPALWPPAPEVWLLLAILMTGVVILIYQWRRFRRRNAYRRAGLVLLTGAHTVRDLSVILKRVALAVFPREQVASLYGEDWTTFLQRTYARRDFSMITQADPEAAASRKAARLAAAWIRHHRPPGRKD
ncbi:MAG: DUF4381 domain-containing protein [Pseudomonadota bacterium]